jgi:Fe-S-cluster-containing hydrogenase component 2
MAIPKIDKEECTGCEECVDACPAECITMKDDVAIINESECTECDACVDACPAECIKSE